MNDLKEREKILIVDDIQNEARTLTILCTMFRKSTNTHKSEVPRETELIKDSIGILTKYLNEL